MSNLAGTAQRAEDIGARLAAIEAALKAQEIPVAVVKAAATIAPGTEEVFLAYAGITTLTIPNPIAGAPGVGSTGQDGATLAITDTTGFAHTITTGTNGINGSKHVATFGGSIGSTLILKAFNGSWWVRFSSGITLS